MVGKSSRHGWGFRVSRGILLLVVFGSILAPWIAPYGPNEMGNAVNQAPSLVHLFGTDSMGRDLLSRVLYGGRSSLFIGVCAALISTLLAILYGTLSGVAGNKLDRVLMRGSDMMQSMPQILLIIFLQAMMGKANEFSLSLAIGVTGWMAMARIIRNEVRRIRGSDFILAAQMMGGSFGYILRRHMLPNFMPAVLYSVVSSIGAAMVTESTLSFLGLGLPVDKASWGGLLTGAQTALLSGEWWLVIIPGAVLIITLICITEAGEEIRKKNTRLHSNL